MNLQDAKAFAGFLDLERFELGASPWARSLSVGDWLKELRSEIEELETALRAGSRAELTSELADVLGDAIKTVICAERAGLTTMAEVIAEAHAKMVRRKPWLVPAMEGRCSPPETMEEEGIIWNRVKAEEREGKK